MLIGVLSPFWLPLPLYRAREAVSSQRRRLHLLDRPASSGNGDGEDGSNVKGGGDSSSAAGRGNGGGGGIGGKTTEAEKVNAGGGGNSTISVLSQRTEDTSRTKHNRP